MEQNRANPLAKHFRQPAIYLRLPSQGTYWKEGSLELSVSKELPVYPMTTKDEITLRTPDALLNGEGIVKVIESCCPNIRDAWEAPSVDIDPILVGIRIASYGNEMEVNSTCPHCEHSSMHAIDLNNVVDRFRMPDFGKIIEVDGLKIKIRPQKYQAVNEANMINFEEQRVLQAVVDDELDENEKSKKFNHHMDRLIDLNLKSLTESTEYIEADDRKVREKEFIYDFYNNASAHVTKAVRERLDELAKEAVLPKVGVICESCEKDYEISVEFNYSSFFAQGS